MIANFFLFCAPVSCNFTLLCLKRFFLILWGMLSSFQIYMGVCFEFSSDDTEITKKQQSVSGNLKNRIRLRTIQNFEIAIFYLPLYTVLLSSIGLGILQSVVN